MRYLGPLLILVVVLSSAWTVFEHPQIDPDDFRYLAIVQELEGGQRSSLFDAFVVENRWDHLWWMDTEAPLKFFRPMMLLSFWLDVKLHGGSYLGLLITNTMLHLLCCLLVHTLLRKICSDPLAALGGTVLFACFACHAESIWYVSGRNAPLAGLFFLAGLACHLQAQDRTWGWRLASLLCYAVALLSKELTAALPLLCFAADRWLRPAAARMGRGSLLSYGGFAVVLVVYLLVRRNATAGASFVFPYLVAPFSSEFLPHLWTQLRSYSENLFFGAITVPFMQPTHLLTYCSWTGFGIAGTAVALLFGIGFRQRRFWFFAGVLFVTWLPTCVAYLSERYLYLPSFAVAGMTAVALEQLRRRKILRWLAIAMVVVWCGHQYHWLRNKNGFFASRPRSAIALEIQLRSVRSELASEKPLLFVNFPGDWLHAQFLQDQMRVLLQRPQQNVHVLTLLNEDDQSSSGPSLRELAPRRLQITGQMDLLDGTETLFPWIDLSSETAVQREALPFSVQIIDGTRQACRELQVHLEEPLDQYLILGFVPPSKRIPQPGQRILRGRLTVLP